MAARIAATLSRAAGLTREDWRFLAIAAKELALARVRHVRQPVDAIFRNLRTLPAVEHRPDRAAWRELELQRLSWAIAAAAARVPWRSDCLLQAMAAHRWLRREGVSADVYVGVRKSGQGDLEAHAWLRHGELTIVGGHTDEFQVVLGPPVKDLEKQRLPR